MAEVKWIKIVTDIFDNRKIRQIEKMPDADAILVIWLKILCLAGEINESGFMMLTKDIPYTDEMLANEFDRPVSTVRMALKIFTSFGMIETFDNVYCVTNWERYQNIAGLEKIREQTRERVSRHRENKKLIVGNVTVTHGNATDIDKELDKDKEKEKDKKPTRHKYGEYSNVLLTDEQLDKLKTEFPDWEKRIERLDEYIQSSGKSYKDHWATIRNWAKRDKAESKDTPKDSKYDYDKIQQKLRDKMWGEK